MKKLPLPYADKSLGQHFLIDNNIITQITENFAKEADAIIEVGPGPGILTESLSKIDLPYFVIEKDERFKDYLDQYLKPEQILFADALQVDYEAYFKEKGLEGKKIWLVSNLPYNISVPLTLMFTNATTIEFMSLMFQREVAEKIFNTKKKKNTAGSLMALTSNFFELDFVVAAPPEAFSPPPKVDSAVISFKRNHSPEIPLEEFHLYEKFLRNLFMQKRKQVGKILGQNYPKDQVISAFEKLELKLTDRSEAFKISDVSRLYKELCYQDKSDKD